MKPLILCFCLCLVACQHTYNKSTITPQSAGSYIIGQSTHEEILGEDSKQMRNTLAQKGFYFEFYRGTTLTGLTIASPQYSLSNGISIGSSQDDVIKHMGPPNNTFISLKPKDIRMDSLVYKDYLFLLDTNKFVSAIRIGKQ